MTGLFLFLTSMNCVLTVATLSSWLALRRRLGGTSLRSITSLQLEVADLRLAFDGVKESFARLNSRVGMRELRARKANEANEPNGEDAIAEVESSSRETPRERKLEQIRAAARKRGLM